MNRKSTKIIVIFLAVAAILSFAATRAFAAFSDSDSALLRLPSGSLSQSLFEDKPKLEDNVVPAAIEDHSAGKVEAGEDQHFSGLISAMDDKSFTIGGMVFQTNNLTKLDNGLAVGVQAKVEFIKNSDGSLLAIEIETNAADNQACDDKGGLMNSGKDDKGGLSNSGSSSSGKGDNSGSSSGKGGSGYSDDSGTGY